MNRTQAGFVKHRVVYRALERDILAGRWGPGQRMPSEAELVRLFEVSRITVGRAMRDLQVAGLVERRVGSGTYVKPRSRVGNGKSFGLLIPDLGEAEVFESICRGMMGSPLAREHALVWGSVGSDGGIEEASKVERARALCHQYIDRRVDGVFFAPLEHAPEKDEANGAIAGALDDAGIPIVLLDRPVVAYPGHGSHDLVGIDNVRAGCLITQHLLRAGARRIAFVGLANAAATVDARESGYREALYQAGRGVEPRLLRRLDPGETDDVGELMETHRPDGIVCANDRTAGRVMHALLGQGYSVPDDIRIVGIDDLAYAELLPVPLTTFRQPTAAIGAAALAAMLDRVMHNDAPARDVLLHGELVVRRSCGVAL